MGNNRIFICHAIRSENEDETKIFRLIMDVLQQAGMEIITYKDNSSQESFFQQLHQELPTCQTFLLLQTRDAIYTPQIHLTVKAAQELFEHKKIYGTFRFICSLAEGAAIPQEWKSLTTFDGTSNYQRACTRLVLNISARYKNRSRKPEVTTTGFLPTLTPVDAKLAPLTPTHSPESAQRSNGTIVGTGLAPVRVPTEGSGELVKVDGLAPAHTPSSEAQSANVPHITPIETAETAALPLSDLARSSETSSQTTFTYSPKTINIAEETSKTAETKRIIESLPTQAIKMLQVVPAKSSPLQVFSTEAVRTNTPPPSLRAVVLKTPPRPNYDRPPKRSWWKKLLRNEETGRPSLFVHILIALVVLLVIGSAGTFLYSSYANRIAAKPASPPPNPTIGQVSFFGSDQIGADNSTGVSDEVQINLSHLTSPTTGHSYYAWLLNAKNSAQGTPILLGNVTVNNGNANLTFANPTHENLLLTKSSFLITEESSSIVPSIPSPDQHVWRYFGTLSQTPDPQDPNHLSNFDYVQHLLAVAPLLQDNKMPGGLGTWFYANVQKVLEWSNAAKGTGEQQSFGTVHRNLVRIMDYLDGATLVPAEVPKGTPIVVEPPQYASIPLLTFDRVHQNPLGYIVNLEADLQELSTSPQATDKQRTLAGQMDTELEKVDGFLQKVHDDAKQLVNLSEKDLADPKNAPIFTDMVNNANNAFVGQLDPATNKRQGGATLVHDLMPQIATIDVKAFTAQ